MHEYGIALQIADLAAEYAKGKRLTQLSIRIGALSGVFDESLKMYLELIAEERGWGSVACTFTLVDAMFLCVCKKEYQIKNMTESCPVCHSYERTAIDGADCRLESIEVDDENDH